MPSFTLDTSAYQGPLEKLLDLIEARKMSVSDVSLAEVTDAYLAYVESLPELPLGETSQFILVASTLLLIKSRALLPTLELSSDERESVQELTERLEKLAQVRAAAKDLRAQWGREPLALMRRAPARPIVFSPAESSPAALASAIARIVATLPTATKLAEASVAPVLALEDVIVSLRRRISSAIRTRWSEIRAGARDRGEVIVYFLAVLELVRSGSASVTQTQLFEDITIEVEQVTAPSYGA